MEKDWRVYSWCLCLEKGWQGVHCQQRRVNPGLSRKTKASSGANGHSCVEAMSPILIHPQFLSRNNETVKAAQGSCSFCICIELLKK